MPENQWRWYAIKIFESDDKVLEKLNISDATLAHIQKDIGKEKMKWTMMLESIITNERYLYISLIIKAVYKKAHKGKLSTSDKIDKIITNRILGLLFSHLLCGAYILSQCSGLENGN